jgi:hypothetical protein
MNCQAALAAPFNALASSREGNSNTVKPETLRNYPNLAESARYPSRMRPLC